MYVYNLDEIFIPIIHTDFEIYESYYLMTIMNIYFLIYNHSQKFPYIIYTKIICVKIKFHEISLLICVYFIIYFIIRLV